MNKLDNSIFNPDGPNPLVSGLDRSTSHATPRKEEIRPQQTLRQCVERVVGAHLELMGTHDPEDFYRFVMDEVEPPLIAEVLKRTRGNQSRAAKILGLNRGTLRKKIQQFNL